MHNLRGLLAGVLMFAGICLAGCGEHYPELPAEGSAAPDFTLMNQNGKPVSLKDYRGQWVVIYFYSNDFYKQSTNDMRSFKSYLAKLQELHMVVLGISHNTIATHKEYVDQEQLPFNLLSDRQMTVAKQYGSFRRTHVTFHMVIFSTFIVNPEGKIARVFYDFGPADPGGEVVNAVSALQHR
jgi:thioredoxin-dependent peroxiredoxin